MKLVANIISWSLIPLIFPTLAMIFVLYTKSNIEYCYQPNCMHNLYEEAKFPVLMVFSMFTLIFPIIFLFILRYGQFINSIELETARERNAPILIMFFCCVTLFVFMVQKFVGNDWPSYLFSLPLSGVVLSAVMFPLNLWKKISIHAGGTGIFVGFMMAYTLKHGFYPVWPLALGLFLSGLVISARLYLEKHTISEVLIGWGVAFVLTFSINFWYTAFV